MPLGEWILREVCASGEGMGGGGPRPDPDVGQPLGPPAAATTGIVELVGRSSDTGLRPRSLVLEADRIDADGAAGRDRPDHPRWPTWASASPSTTSAPATRSLSYLKNFPVTTLKIDRSFIAGITADPDDAAITTAIIALARAMELDVGRRRSGDRSPGRVPAGPRLPEDSGLSVGRPMGREEFEAGLVAAASQQPPAPSRPPSKGPGRRLKAAG